VLGSYHSANQVLASYVSAAVGGGDALTGVLVSCIYAGGIPLVATLGYLGDRAGKRRCATLTAVALLIGSSLLTVASSSIMACVAYVFVGAGLSSLESMALSLIEDNNRDDAGRIINLTNAFFSVGSVISPIAVTAWLKRGSFNMAYMVFVGASLALAVVYAFFKKIDDFAIRLDNSHGSAVGDIKNMFKTPALLLCMLSMMLYLGVESSFTYWGTQYVRDLGYEYASTIVLSVFWFAVIIGRVVSTLMKDPVVLLPYCFVGMGSSLILFGLLPGEWTKIGAAFLLGIFAASMYGTILFLGGHIFPKNSAMAYSFMVISASTGGVIAQPIIGGAASVVSIDTIFIVAGCIAVATTALILVAMKMAKKATA